MYLAQETPPTFTGSMDPMAEGSMPSHFENEVWSGSRTRTGLMLATLAMTDSTKDSSTMAMEDRARSGNMASNNLEENPKVRDVVFLGGSSIGHDRSPKKQAWKWAIKKNYRDDVQNGQSDWFGSTLIWLLVCPILLWMKRVLH